MINVNCVAIGKILKVPFQKAQEPSPYLLTIIRYRRIVHMVAMYIYYCYSNMEQNALSTSPNYYKSCISINLK